LLKKKPRRTLLAEARSLLAESAWIPANSIASRGISAMCHDLDERPVIVQEWSYLIQAMIQHVIE
jgi:hypothetical protein